MKKLEFKPDDFCIAITKYVGNILVVDSLGKDTEEKLAKIAQELFDKWYEENFFTKEALDIAEKEAKELENYFSSKCTCIDCGVATKPGPGSARCKSCWDDKCGTKKD